LQIEAQPLGQMLFILDHQHAAHGLALMTLASW
jgi:hypothetical protein